MALLVCRCLRGIPCLPFKAAYSALASDPQGDMQDTWGIQVVSLRTTAAGSMLDFRYKVLDAKKAESLFVRKTKPYLIHQESGKVLSVPVTAKVGPCAAPTNPSRTGFTGCFSATRPSWSNPATKSLWPSENSGLKT